jgi:alanine racemase
MSYIKLSKKNYFYNLDTILKKTKSKDKIALVLKDNAYGHGLVEIATLAKEYGIKKAVVRNYNEAIKIKNYFEYILILADTNITTFSHTFHIAINNIDDISKLPPNSNIHLKIDTSMHRNGIAPNMLKEAIYRALEHNLNITGIFTHFKSADSFNSELFYQKALFNSLKIEVLNLCEKLNIQPPSFHIANSSALFRCDDVVYDFVRIGLASYGYILLDQEFKKPLLKPVLSLYANKLNTIYLTKNQTIGYNGKFQAKCNMVISTYDIGYADGFRRIANNDEFLLDTGYKILGTISMDSMAIDTNKDEICLFDNISSLAHFHNTIEYELLVNLNPNIKRIII